MRCLIKAYKVKKAAIFAFLLLLITIIILNPKSAIDAAKSGLHLCSNILVPSLFAFFVFSGLLINFGFANWIGKVLSPIMKPLFNVNGSGALAFVLGIVSGYPLGASCACDLYNNKCCSKQEAERLLAFCNNSGPLFIIGSVGASMYNSRYAGIILYITHILAAVSVGILFRFYKQNIAVGNKFMPASINTASFGEILSDVMRRSINTMLLICGFVIVFSVVINTIFSWITNIWLNNTFGAILYGFLELTGGLYKASALSIPVSTKLIISASILGFAGFSVHFQVMGIVAKSDLSIKPYLLGKALQSVISAIYMYLALKITNPYLEVLAIPNNKFFAPFNIMDFRTAIAISFTYLLVSAVFILSLCIFSMIVNKLSKNKHY